jgi:hypothetical protein
MSKAHRKDTHQAHRQPSQPQTTSPEDIDIAHQFLADALHAGEPRSDTARRAASPERADPLAEEHTRTRRRVDLRGDAVVEGSLFDEEAEEPGETDAPELDTEDRPHRVTRPRTPQR